MRKRKVLLFGGTGLLGSALKAELEGAGYDIIAPLHQKLDILNYSLVLKCVRDFDREVIINCAGYNEVDDCEKNKELAFKANAEGPFNLAKVAKEARIMLFHISTDYVFSGEKKEEYLEDDPPAPLNFYGKSKLDGEILIQKNADDFCIIRTSWLFGPGRKNFITKILKKWREGTGELKVVSDEFGRPTYTLDFARVIRLSLESELRGIYHFSNYGIVSWFEFAKEIFEIIGEGPKLLPISADEYGLPARRPKNSALNTSKIEKALNLKIRHHYEALREYLKRI